MKRVVVALGLSLLSNAALAQAIDCSAFEHRKDGSWVVTKTTALGGVQNGVDMHVGLAPGDIFSRDGKSSMDNVDVLEQVETHCH